MRNSRPEGAGLVEPDRDTTAETPHICLACPPHYPLTELELIRLIELRMHIDPLERTLAELRLEFAAWLVQHSRLTEDC